MAEKNKQEMDIFIRRVLACVQEQSRTAEEIRRIYLDHYPQSLVEKTFHLAPVGVDKIRKALLWLIAEDFVHKELTNFTFIPLKKETEIFWISNAGRSYLHRKK